MSGMVSLSVLLAACGLLEVLRAILENVVFYGPSAKVCTVVEFAYMVLLAYPDI
jgi:hypothetical protein